jgi:hypothetical protein
MDEVVRMFLVLGHLLALMGAAVGVAFGDYALLGRRHIHHPLLEKASHGVALALGGLWLTGLGLIWVDTRFDMALLWSKPKLLAKLTVVLLLTANGLLLHAKVLPALRLRLADRRALQQTALLATRAGAISAACWAFGVFLGVARPLAPILGYAGFMSLFAVTMVGALLVSRRAVYPELLTRLSTADPGQGARAVSSPPVSSAGATVAETLAAAMDADDLDGPHISAA